MKRRPRWRCGYCGAVGYVDDEPTASPYPGFAHWFAERLAKEAES